MYNGVIEVIGRLTVPILMTMIPVIGVWGIWWSTGVVWLVSGMTALDRYARYKKNIFKNTLHKLSENR